MALQPENLPLTLKESGELRVESFAGVDAKAKEALGPNKTLNFTALREAGISVEANFSLLLEKGNTLSQRISEDLFRKKYTELSKEEKYFIAVLDAILKQNGIFSDRLAAGDSFIFDFGKGKFLYRPKTDPERNGDLVFKSPDAISKKTREEVEALIGELERNNILHDAMRRFNDDPSFAGRTGFIKEHGASFIDLINQRIADPKQKLAQDAADYGYRGTAIQNIAYLKAYLILKRAERLGEALPSATEAAPAPTEATAAPAEAKEEPASQPEETEPSEADKWEKAKKEVDAEVRRIEEDQNTLAVNRAASALGLYLAVNNPEDVDTLTQHYQNETNSFIRDKMSRFQPYVQGPSGTTFRVNIKGGLDSSASAKIEAADRNYALEASVPAPDENAIITYLGAQARKGLILDRDKVRAMVTSAHLFEEMKATVARVLPKIEKDYAKFKEEKDRDQLESDVQKGINAGEQTRLRQEMTLLANRGAWEGVDLAYQKMLGNPGITPSPEDHYTGGFAAEQLGDLSAAVQRFEKAASLEKAQTELNFIKDHAVKVDIKVSKKYNAITSLPTTLFPPLNANMLFARAVLLKTGRFEGYLSKGEYTFGYKKVVIGANPNSVQVENLK